MATKLLFLQSFVFIKLFHLIINLVGTCEGFFKHYKYK